MGVAGVREEALAAAVLAGAEWEVIVLEPALVVIASARLVERKLLTRRGCLATT